jgi:hypothetical protein
LLAAGFELLSDLGVVEPVESVLLEVLEESDVALLAAAGLDADVEAERLSVR